MSRRRTRVVAFLWLACCAVLSAPVAAQGPADFDPEITAQIERLADPRYTERRDARRRLLDFGLSAFDAIAASTDHPDPEVAATCSELLHGLTRDWSRRTDPPWVRRMMRSYGDKSPDERLVTVRTLGASRQELTAYTLARIARFDPSQRVSREASATLLGSGQLESDPQQFEALRAAEARLAEAYGPSHRRAARWLSIAMREDIAPEQRVVEWESEIASEERLLEEDPSLSDDSVLAALLAQRLIAAADAENGATLLSAVESYVGLDEDRATRRLTDALELLSMSQHWDTADQTLDSLGELLGEKRALYARAQIAHARGQTERGERLADEALQTNPESAAAVNLGGRVRVGPEVRLAEELLDAGHVEWARRELRALGEELRPLTFDVAYARWRLADSLQDAELYAEAAGLLAGLSEVIGENQHTRRLYKSISGRSSFLLPDESVVNARRWLYQAHSLRAKGDRSGEIDALEKAIAHEPGDADVLIAMHRVVDPPKDLVQETTERIIELCEDFEEMIAEEPGDPTAYNQWAWLVSNTVGDYAKAVRYSRRSLELSPGEAGYLDTLGRCLFSAGDLQGAIEAQRQAVEKKPTMLVMKRQLEMFERALETQSEEGAP